MCNKVLLFIMSLTLLVGVSAQASLHGTEVVLEDIANDAEMAFPMC